MNETVWLRLSIHGRVQGVGYRESMRREAQRLGVAGWAQNRPDGTVAAVVQGPPLAVRLLVDWCRRGPVGARVDDVQTWQEGLDGGGGSAQNAAFVILR